MREEKHQARELIQRAREERSEAKEEGERLREERDEAREESRRAKEGKERLESKVALLQERCDRLSCRIRYCFLHRTFTQPMLSLPASPNRITDDYGLTSCPISELEQGEEVSASPRPETKQEKKRTVKAEVTAPSSDRKDLPLHVEDLDDPPLSPVPDSHSSMDE